MENLFNTTMGVLIAIGSLLLGLGVMWGAYWWGSKHRVRLMRRLVKRKEGAPTAEQFVMKQADDGAMEIILSKRAYKALKQAPLQGLVEGSRNKMVLRIRVK